MERNKGIPDGTSLRECMQMFSGDKLLRAITEDIEACLKAKDACNPADTRAQNRQKYQIDFGRDQTPLIHESQITRD
jgi:hypothetical protein